ncbi:chorion class B protein PC10 [Manduca sexta]|uniref:Uncharacterized protein n=1 Tax=Manduca sexta TaxID=7130 RepID=A0A921YY81_MANSE|nr:chorion class B protein PC10 [Manduca sexta]KAG6447205.1 hypothetical protein O3G_MSEX004801 [Manduca sexta]KAG6447206.1 hypothetical protein O3G_MSEX004801 [Manduca sexta]
MEFKTVICFSALVIQTISAQCFGNAFNGFGPGMPELAYPGPYGPNMGCGLNTGLVGLGNAFGPGPCAGPVIATEPYVPAALANMPPPGMSICSDNLLIEGPVVIAGRMPFVGSVGVEGIFPTAGAGAVSYGCGDGAVGIVAEGPRAPVAEFAYGPGLAEGVMYGAGPLGCGSRMLY